MSRNYATVLWYLSNVFVKTFNPSLNYNFQNTFLVPLHQLLYQLSFHFSDCLYLVTDWLGLTQYIPHLCMATTLSHYMHSNGIIVEHSCNEWSEKYFIFLWKLVLLIANMLATHKKMIWEKNYCLSILWKIVSVYFWKEKVWDTVGI